MQLDVLKYSWDAQAWSFLMVTNIMNYLSISKNSENSILESHFIFFSILCRRMKGRNAVCFVFPSKMFLLFSTKFMLKRDDQPDLIYFFIHIVYQHNPELTFTFHSSVQKCFYHEKIAALLKFKSITHNWDINSRIVRGYVELFSAAVNCTWLCFWSRTLKNMGIAETFSEGDKFCRMIISVKRYIIDFRLHFPQCTE